MRIAWWLIILWQVFFLSIFLPAHKRGAYGSVAGSPSASMEQGDSCCSKKAHPANSKEPTDQQRRDCIVCYFAAGHTVEPVFAIDLSHAERVLEQTYIVLSQRTSVPFALMYYPVGPPESC